MPLISTVYYGIKNKPLTVHQRLTKVSNQHTRIIFLFIRWLILFTVDTLTFIISAHLSSGIFCVRNSKSCRSSGVKLQYSRKKSNSNTVKSHTFKITPLIVLLCLCQIKMYSLYRFHSAYLSLPVVYRDLLSAVPCVPVMPILDAHNMPVYPEHIRPRWMVSAKIIYRVNMLSVVVYDIPAEAILTQIRTPDSISTWHVRQRKPIHG